VLSYASLGATAVWNEVGDDDSRVLAEGLDGFGVPVPQWLAGRTSAATDLRSVTGCNVVGLVRNGTDRVEPAPTANEPVPAPTGPSGWPGPPWSRRTSRRCTPPWCPSRARRSVWP
jgi:hypothetical protein